MQELIKQRLNIIANQSLLDSVQYLQTSLIAGVRNNVDIALYDEEYAELRNKLMQAIVTKDLIPAFIISYNNARSCEEYISTKIYEFNKREEFINEEFSKLIDSLKSNKNVFNPRTLEKFREVINHEIIYRNGLNLVKLFNSFGFNDAYDKGFPSRHMYTDDKLSKMKFNDIKKLIESLLEPINFISKEKELLNLINDLNKYLIYDNLILTKNANKVLFKPCNQNTSSLISGFEIEEAHILELWNKSIKRIKEDKDFDGALTSAKSMLESVFFYILSECKVEYDTKKDNMPALYQKVVDSLNMDTKKHDDKILKQILTGIKTTFTGFIELRNRFSDSHGKEKLYKLKARHSELAVNLAGTVAIFFYKTLKEQKNL